MKKVLIIEGGRYIGGGQIMTLNISEVLCQTNNIVIAVPNNNPELSNLLGKFCLVKYNSIMIKNGKKTVVDFINYLLESLIFIPKMYFSAKKLNVDLIYIQSQKMVPMGVLIGKLINKPVLVHLHVYHTDAKSRKILNLFLQSKCVKKIIGVSKYTLSQLNSKNFSKSEVIYNFIDLNRQNISININQNNVNYFDSKQFNIAVIANITPDKGQFTAVQAINILKTHNAKLFIIGAVRDTEYYKKLITFIRENSLEDFVVFMGHISDISEILDCINLVLVPSTLAFETFSLSMVEAWSKGIPTVSSNLGGMKELVETFMPIYRDKLLFSDNKVSELVDKCLYFIDEKNNKEYQIIANELRFICNKVFSKDNFKQEIDKIIKSM